MNGIRLIGAPLDLGAGRRGVDMGPTALRIAGLAPTLRGMGYEVTDAGNLPVPQRETLLEMDPRRRFAGPIGELCDRLHGSVSEALHMGVTPLVLGGDHSLTMGSAAAASAYVKARGGRLGILWLDAHGDMNTPETTVSGNVHGMSLSHLLGRFQDPALGRGPASFTGADVALLGVRDLDDAEGPAILDAGVRVATMRDIDRQGLETVVRTHVDALLKRCTHLHVSFDVDFVDPDIAPGVGTPVRGGPTYRDAHLVMELLADTGAVLSVDVVEVNPVLDHGNRTAELAVDLLASLFGRKIL
jgi:arginase